MENKQIIEKAAMTLADLAGGGLLSPAQANKFLRMVQDAPTIINSARFVPMSHDSQKVEKIGFGQRILRPGVEGTALAEGDKSVPTTSTVQLNAKEVIAEVNITYDTLENNIEKGNLYNTIMRMIAERAALDLEELVVNGDTASTDPYLAVLDGIRKQATAHVVDWAVTADPNKAGHLMINKDVFKAGIKAMPKKYYRNPADFRFFTSYNAQVEYMDSIAARQSTLGDRALQGGLPTAYGTPVQGIAMLQGVEEVIDETSGETAVRSDVLFTHPKNILFGMSRNIRIEVDRDIRERKFIIVLTAKIDTKFEEPDAVVKIENVQE